MDGFTVIGLIAWAFFWSGFSGAAALITHIPPPDTYVAPPLSIECRAALSSTGHVRFYSATKGYGFIVPDQGGEHVFVHARDLERNGLVSLRDRQMVGYEPRTDRGRPRIDRICV